MRHLIRILLAVLVLLLVVPVVAYAQGTGDGEITGQVVNGTEDGGSVAGVVITLIDYVDDTLSGTTKTTTDQEGEFRFENVTREHTYLVSAAYMNVDYYYPVNFKPGAETAYVTVWVCDVTDSDHAISISIAHTVINVTEDNLEVTAVYWLINAGDMTYVGTDGALVFTLPEGAFGFEVPPELMIDYQLLEGNRVAYLVPFPPGERQLAYSYRLAKPATAEFTISLKIDYPTDNLSIMIGGEDIEVAVTQLAPAEPVVIDTGERFIHFQGINLTRNTMIDLHLSDLSRGNNTPLIVLLAVAAVVIIGLVVYIVMRRKKRAGVDG